MSRIARTLLGIAAVGTTTLALTLSGTVAHAAAPATPAAAPVAASAPADHYDEWYGPYYSKWFHESRAKATKIHVWDDGDKVHVKGKLYDKYSPWWLCGYVQVKFENEDGDDKTYWAKKCGTHGYKNFHFYEHDVDTVQVRACYWNDKLHKKVLCGKWDYIYEADGGHEEEEEA
jgi:hypothetical protein